MMRLTMSKTFAIFTLLVVGLLATAPASAAEWGSLKGRFVVDGKPVELKPLNVDKDAFCIENKPKNEAIVIGKDNALVNTVVYLRLPRRGEVAIHPDYEAKLKEPAVLDNVGCSFKPRVTLVRVGQTLVVKNSDPTGHNTNVSLFGFNPVVPAKGQLEVKATKDAPLPSPVQCNIHPFMIGHLLAQKHPYMAVTGDDGSFEIKNMPAGKHEIQLWHEATGYLKDIATKGGKANRQGRLNVTIAASQTLDLGDIKVPAAMLKPR
jgi:hypothetical protein